MRTCILQLSLAFLFACGCFGQDRLEHTLDLPNAVAEKVDERFRQDDLVSARQELRSYIKKSEEFQATPFPISFNVIQKFADNIYEVRNRTTGGTAILKTTKTEFRTTGIANLVVSKSDSIKLPMENGVERSFDVFIEQDAEEDRYWELKKQLEAHRKQFWNMLYASNVPPATTKQEFAKMLNVTVHEIEYVHSPPNRFHKGTLHDWKKEFDAREAAEIASSPKAIRAAQLKQFAQMEADLDSAELQFDKIDEIKRNKLSVPITHEDGFVHEKGLTLMRGVIKELIPEGDRYIDLAERGKLYEDHLLIENKKYYGQFNSYGNKWKYSGKNSEDARMILRLAREVIEGRKAKIE